MSFAASPSTNETTPSSLPEVAASKRGNPPAGAGLVREIWKVVEPTSSLTVRLFSSWGKKARLSLAGMVTSYVRSPSRANPVLSTNPVPSANASVKVKVSSTSLSESSVIKISKLAFPSADAGGVTSTSMLSFVLSVSSVFVSTMFLLLYVASPPKTPAPVISRGINIPPAGMVKSPAVSNSIL